MYKRKRMTLNEFFQVVNKDNYLTLYDAKNVYYSLTNEYIGFNEKISSLINKSEIKSLMDREIIKVDLCQMKVKDKFNETVDINCFKVCLV